MTAGADKVGECGDSQTVLNKIWDPTYERALPLGTITMLAMSAIRYSHKYGMSQEDMAAVVRRFGKDVLHEARLMARSEKKPVWQALALIWFDTARSTAWAAHCAARTCSPATRANRAPRGTARSLALPKSHPRS